MTQHSFNCFDLNKKERLTTPTVTQICYVICFSSHFLDQMYLSEDISMFHNLNTHY